MTSTTDYAVVDWRVCTMCGVRQSGQHRTPLECIIALREVIAGYEFRTDQLLEKNLDRGRMKRSNNRFVILNGERMCLSDAARELRMTVKALRHRIHRRIGAVVETVDLRAIDIDADKRYARKTGQAGCKSHREAEVCS
jgi:hypothetical protein